MPNRRPVKRSKTSLRFSFQDVSVLVARFGIAILVGLATVTGWLVQDKARDMIDRQDKIVEAVIKVKDGISDLSAKLSAVLVHEADTDRRMSTQDDMLNKLEQAEQDQEHRITRLEALVPLKKE